MVEVIDSDLLDCMDTRAQARATKGVQEVNKQCSGCCLSNGGTISAGKDAKKCRLPKGFFVYKKDKEEKNNTVLNK